MKAAANAAKSGTWLGWLEFLTGCQFEFCVCGLLLPGRTLCDAEEKLGDVRG